MKSKEIYQAIDLSKVGPTLKTKLTALEKVTEGFTNERADANMDKAMNGIYDYLKKSNPESLKNIEVKTVEVEEKVETIVEGKPVKKTTKTKKKVAGKKKKVASKTKTPSNVVKKPTVSSVASKIRKPGESWKDALGRAKVIFNDKKQTQVAKTKKAVDDLRDFLKDDKNFRGWPRTYGKEKASDNSLERDAQRQASPPGKRVSKTGRVYYENRDNRSDREANAFPRKIYLKEGGDIMIEPTILQNNPDYLVGTETMYEMFAKGGITSPGLFKIEDEVREKLKFDSGSEILSTQENRIKFSKAIDDALKARGVAKESLSIRIFRKLEDENSHILNEFLILNEYYQPSVWPEGKKFYFERFKENPRGGLGKDGIIGASFKAPKGTSKGYTSHDKIKLIIIKNPNPNSKKKFLQIDGRDVLNGVYDSNAFAKGGTLPKGYKYIRRADISQVVTKKNEIIFDSKNGFWVNEDALVSAETRYAAGGEVFIPTTYLDYNPDYLVGTNTMYEMFANGGIMAKGGSILEDISECKKLVSAFCKEFGEKFGLDEEKVLKEVKFQDYLGYGASVFIYLSITSNVTDLKVGETKPRNGYIKISSGINPNGITGKDDIARTYVIDIELKGDKRYTQRKTEEGRYFKSYQYGRTIDDVMDATDTKIIYDLSPLEKKDDLKFKMSGVMAKGGITYKNLSLEKPSLVNETKIQSERFKINEIDLFRKSQNTFSGSPIIRSSADSVKIFREFWDEQSLTIFESFNVMLLNQANKVIGLYQHSKGGVTGTVADPEMVVLSAVKSLAKGVIISHNHPSGNLRPSQADIEMTNKIKNALKFVDVLLLDSIIITENSYYSFADEGIMALGGMTADGGMMSKGGALEHMILLGDKVLDIYKNVLIVESAYGGVTVLDFRQEPIARRILVERITGKNTLASAKEFIDADPSFKTQSMAVGGSLQGHGFEVGDRIAEDLGGYIRVVSEDGKDYFIKLRDGDRLTEPPLPFKHGGKVKHSDVTRLATKTNEAGDEVVDLTEFYEGGGNVPKVFDVPAQFLDAEGKRKNDRKTIKELTDFVLALPQTKEIYYNDELGDYTPSRKKLHAEIINKFKKEVVCINNDQPIAIFMGGSPASGKSSFLRKYSPFLLKEEILKIDADEIRAMLPEYEGWNATQTHLETKDIVNILLSNKNIGIPCDFDIIYDGTMNSVKSYIPLMDILRKRGYKIFIVFMDNVPKDVIIKRALDRYKTSGRFVPLEVIEDFFSKGKTAFNELKKDVDGYMLIDGSSRDYNVIEEGGIKLPRDREYSKLGTKIKASDIPVSYKKGGLSLLY
jgi:predicted ABC-type ATPase